MFTGNGNDNTWFGFFDILKNYAPIEYKIESETLLDDLGINDFDIEEIIMRIEDELDVEIDTPVSEFYAVSTFVLETETAINKRIDTSNYRFPKVPSFYVHSIINTYGEEIQDTILIEELSELQKEITKSMRGKEDKAHLAEEIAHCLISIQMCMVTHNVTVDMLQSEINKKVEKYKNMKN